MAGKGYRQGKAVESGVTRFTRSPMSEVEMSRMSAVAKVKTTMNAGDIVPVYYEEVLPHDTFKVSVRDIIRQATTLRPTMDSMIVDIIPVWVPNRIVNESWVNVQGENTSGFWSAPVVNLAPLYTGTQDVQIPIGSVADYYGFPTQRPIKASILQQCNDTKFRGYLCCYNELFRDQNYQTPLSWSKLNVYEGFFEASGSYVSLAGDSSNVFNLDQSDGSFVSGALTKAIYGEGEQSVSGSTAVLTPRITTWSALDKPLKANKLHDWITSGLPSPQKGTEVFFGIGDVADVSLYADDTTNALGGDLKLKFSQALASGNSKIGLKTSNAGQTVAVPAASPDLDDDGAGFDNTIVGTNLKGIANLADATGVSVNDLRLAIATQQVYEQLARGGSRYREIISSFFGLDTENIFTEIPVVLGRYRHELDLYQVAQTSASTEDSATADLSAYGYTASNGFLFERTFIEHGYIHFFAIIRHQNTYSTYFAPDNFRRATLDFYLPPLANIGEQPIRLAALNPFVEENGRVIAYQEAWWEYRYKVDRVSGAFRSMPADRQSESLNVWTYADDFDEDFEVVTGDWLKSNSEEVLNRTLDTPTMIDGKPTGYPQFKVQLAFDIVQQRPLPVYSVPGLDVI